MNIEIMSRERIERMAQRPFPPGTAVISITDSDAFPLAFRCRPDFLLATVFDDMEPESDLFNALCEDYPDFRNECRIITGAQAGEIADFARLVYPIADLLICQCECGQSRSAAVAAAVMEHFTGSGRAVFGDKRYSPNEYAFKLILEKLDEKSI